MKLVVLVVLIIHPHNTKLSYLDHRVHFPRKLVVIS